METVGWYLVVVGLYGTVWIAGTRWRIRRCRRAGRHEWILTEYGLTCAQCDRRHNPPDLDR